MDSNSVLISVLIIADIAVLAAFWLTRRKSH